MEQSPPTSTKPQTPKKYFQIKLAYSDTTVMTSMETKVPASPYWVTFYTSFLYVKGECTRRLRLRVILGMIVICEIIISPLPILATMEKPRTAPGEVKGRKKTRGRQTMSSRAPRM